MSKLERAFWIVFCGWAALAVIGLTVAGSIHIYLDTVKKISG